MSARVDDRVTTRLGSSLFAGFEQWRVQNGFSTRSEAVRAIIATAIASPLDSAWLAAYGQALGELRRAAMDAARVVGENLRAVAERSGR
jgi:Arc/MetJ-type ribon-helix-helix transcriptional regulator